MLEVVEHEQQAPVAHVCGEGFAAPDRHAEGLRDRRQDEIGVCQRSKRDEEDAVGKLVEELGRGVQRQPRLARAAGARQRDDPGLRPAEQVGELLDLPLATDERCRLKRKVGRVALEAPERRELAVQLRRGELEHALSRHQVPQPVVAEIDHVGLVQPRLAQEVARGLREEDLPGVGRAP